MNNYLQWQCSASGIEFNPNGYITATGISNLYEPQEYIQTRATVVLHKVKCPYCGSYGERFSNCTHCGGAID
jgi:hypothetical protein